MAIRPEGAYTAVLTAVGTNPARRDDGHEETARAPREGALSRSQVAGVSILRLLVEAVVVVGSILLAFAIDAAWEGRLARERELSYLHLLAADLTTTLDINARITGEAGQIDPAGAKLARAYFLTEPPPRDSVLLWLSLVQGRRWAGPQLGTARSLAQGGNLDLLRHDSLRAAIPRYLRSMELQEMFEERAMSDFEAARDELRRLIDLEAVDLELLARHARDSIAAVESRARFPGGSLRPLESARYDRLVMRADVHAALAQMNAAKRRLANQHRNMRAHSEWLLALVEDALADSGG